jgi:hypothetical protein
MGDMVHMKWALRAGANMTNDFGGVNRKRFNGCPGTALNDAISGEMCFTHQDIGLEAYGVVADSHNHTMNADYPNGSFSLSSPLSKSPHQRCTTIAEIFTWTTSVEAKGTHTPYTYDIIHEEFTWQAQDPTQACPSSRELCSTTAPVKIVGNVI